MDLGVDIPDRSTAHRLRYVSRGWGVFDLCAHPTELRTIALAAIPRVTRRWQLPNARCGF
jgi:hypothetical protein